MISNMSVLCWVSNLVFIVGIISFICISSVVSTCPLIESCVNQPCDCNEDNLSCDVCQDKQGCDRCIDDYFRIDYDSKCVECESIDGCLHCTNDKGCQQCDSGRCSSQPVYNEECGMYVCDCDGSNNTPNPTKDPTTDPTSDPTSEPTQDPTTEPTRDPTSNPIPPPTSSPTLVPTRDTSDTPGIQTAFTDLLTGDDPNSVSLWFTSDAEICWGNYDCDNGETLLTFAGICDKNTISTVGDNVFLNNRNIWTFYRCCENSILGTFWMKGMACFVFDQESGLIRNAYINFDENDIIQEYFDQYLLL